METIPSATPAEGSAVMTTDQEKTSLRPDTLHAIDVLRGAAAGSDVAHQITGAKNSYNSKGRGSTLVRRVLRDGAWQWVSGPASRGRFLAADRNDIQYGPVWEGEVVASYTLGRSAPDGFSLALAAPRADGGAIVKLTHVRTRGGYRLSIKDEIIADVSDPTWR